jgi:hypothetical protein
MVLVDDLAAQIRAPRAEHEPELAVVEIDTGANQPDRVQSQLDGLLEERIDLLDGEQRAERKEQLNGVGGCWAATPRRGGRLLPQNNRPIDASPLGHQTLARLAVCFWDNKSTNLATVHHYATCGPIMRRRTILRLGDCALGEHP